MTDPLLAPALTWSGYLRRRVQARPELAGWLAQAARAPVTPCAVQAGYQELGGGPGLSPAGLRPALRRLRERVFCALMVRDVAGLADFDEVVGVTTALAELAVAEVYRAVAAELAAIHGMPRDARTDAPQEMLIVGMGKLGGAELNVSSDIDLVMLFDAEGDSGADTDGARPISHHEFYCKLTQRMMPLLSEPNAEGYVFRTDLRLRPDGDGSPVAWSLAALERYLVEQGREWERYAWLKGRVLSAQAFDESRPQASRQALEALRQPFVYRQYFDFDALAALRALRTRIRLDWERRVATKNGVDADHNIKLGTGGIREVEFVVQLVQLIRGGRMPALQQRGLIAALHAQRDAGLLAADTARDLEAAYRFLRRTEHMLQYREDEQTHLLPRDPETHAQLAAAMGMATDDFTRTLANYRGFVHAQFRNAFRLAGVGDGEDGKTASASASTHAPKPEPVAEPASPPADTLQLDQHPDVQARMTRLRDSPRLRNLPATSRRRLDALLPAALAAANASEVPLAAATRLLDFLDTIAPRSAYLALLAEYPDTLARVARMMATSAWAAQYLTRHPLLLDALIDWRALFKPLDIARIGTQLRRDLDACVLPDGAPDIEAQMNRMRDVQRQTSFQLLAQDLEGQLSVEALADQLSALADMLLSETLRCVWPLVNRDESAREVSPRFAIIAYGKLGGKELGYNSDLDLVFLYDDARPDAADIYARLARRMMSWLSTMTASGRLYDADLRLRPDGNAGLLAVPIAAFAQYQHDHAWVWEHQAITRARFCAGDAAIGAQFEAIRRDILLRPRDAVTLAEEVRAMRARIHAAHPNPTDDFDVKHDRGGMVDVEFVTQFLVLRYAGQVPALLQNLGNIALLPIAAEAGLVPLALAQAAADAYRSLRRAQHRLRLQGSEQARVAAGEHASDRAAVIALWEAVLGADDSGGH